MPKPAHHDHCGHGASAGLSAAELRLLVRLVRKDAVGIERAFDQHPEKIDPLAEACARSGLGVVLLRALADSPMRTALAPERLAVLEARQQRQRERHQVLGALLERIAERFRVAGQRFLLLKGAYLADRYYGDPVGREFGDLDLLIPRADRVGASQLLIELGFSQRSRNFVSAALTAHFVHGFDFAGQGGRVDLHWALSRHPSLRIDEPALWSRASSWSLAGQRFEVLGARDEILLAVLSLLRDTERGRAKPKNVVDIIQILAALDPELDWDTLLAARDGTRGPLVNVLATCLELCLAHDLAPRLSAALAQHGDRRVPALATDSPLLFWPAPFALGNKRWAAQVYDTSAPAWLGWWALSLPFRLAVHRPGPPRTASPGSAR